jgi:hypothetical protein
MLLRHPWGNDAPWANLLAKWWWPSISTNEDNNGAKRRQQWEQEDAGTVASGGDGRHLLQGILFPFFIS